MDQSSPSAPAPAPAPAAATGSWLRGLAAAVAVLALAVAYLIGSDGSGAVAASLSPSPTAADGLAGEARTLTMTGSGTASVVPDQLAFGLSVTLVRDDLDTALADTSNRIQRVFLALRRAGVARSDLQTSGLDMEPEYDYSGEGRPRLVGYRVTQQAQVLVRRLSVGGRAVSAAVVTGGNAVRVSGLRLKVGDPAKAQEKARTEAVAEATEKARQYARATGQGLGRVLTLRESDPSGSTPRGGYVLQRAAGASVAEDLDAVIIRAGQDDLTVRVQVVWEFGDDAR